MTKYICIFLLIGCFISAQSDWPKWRGKHSTSNVQNNQNLDKDKTYTFKTLWKRSLGSGYSSISIWDQYAVTMYSDGKKDYVVARNAHSGEDIWQYTLGDTYVGHDGSHDGPISTPIINENQVFAIDATGKLVALNLGDGALLWKVNLAEKHQVQKPFYGFGTSPIVFKHLLIVQAGANKGTVSAFNKQDGSLVWTMGNDTVNYQSPIIIRKGDENLLLCGGDKHLYGVEPLSGKEIWRYEHNGGYWSASAVVVREDPWQIFLQYKGGEAILLELTDDNENPVKQIWKTKHIKKSFCPVVVSQEKIYGYSGRFFSCIDAKTGKKIWKSRQPGDGFFVVVNNHFVMITKDGNLHLANDDSGKYHSLNHKKLFDSLVWSPPSIAHNKIYLRSLGEMACVAITEQKAISEQKNKLVQPKIKGKFSDFVAKVEAAKNKKKLIDTFMKEQKNFPIMEDGSIHFVFRGKAEDVAFEGDIIGFRIDQPMQKIAGTDFFYFSAHLENNARVSYRFIKDFEEIITDPLNALKTKNYFGSFSDAIMPEWKEASYLQEAKTKGTITKHTLESKLYQDKRELQVYTPHDYDSKKSYATLFVHDGVSTLQEGKWKNTLDNLLGKDVSSAVVVFVPQKHGREYSSAASRGQYIEMLVKEWVPFLEENYSTKGQPKFNIGFVSGATVSLYATTEHPEVFSGGASVSAFYLKKEEQELGSLVQKLPKNIKFYISWGKYDLRSPYEGWSLIESGANVSKAIQENELFCAGGEFIGGFSWHNWRNENGKILSAFLK